MAPSLVQEAVKYVRELRDLGMFQADTGSLSFRDGENLWITKSGAEKYEEDGLVLVNPSGKPVSDFSVKLSGEYPVHQAILYHGTHQALIHTHSAFHVAFGNVFPNYSFDHPALEMRKLLGIRNPQATYVLRTVPNSFDKLELSRLVSVELANDLAVLVQNHGLFVAGEDLAAARTYTFALDHLMHQVYYETIMRGSIHSPHAIS